MCFITRVNRLVSITGQSMNDVEKRSLVRFRDWAKTYDRKTLSYLNYYLTNKAVIKHLRLPTHGSILDVGCGTGILLQQLINKPPSNIQLHGLDISPDMFDKAKRKFSATPQIKLAIGSALSMPYADDTFDCVVCCHSFHHHSDSFRSLSEMRRVVKPNGQVIVMDLSLDGFLRNIFSKIENIYGNEGHICRYGKKQINELFRMAQFKNTMQKYIYYFNLVTIGTKQ